MKGKSKEETMKKVKGLPSAALPRCKDNAAYELESALAEHKALAPIAKYGGALGRDLDRLADSCCRCAAAWWAANSGRLDACVNMAEEAQFWGAGVEHMVAVLRHLPLMWYA